MRSFSIRGCAQGITRRALEAEGTASGFIPVQAAQACSRTGPVKKGAAVAQIHPQTNPYGDSRFAGCDSHHLPHHPRVGPGPGSGGSGRARNPRGDGGLAHRQRVGRPHLASVRQLHRWRRPGQPGHLVLQPVTAEIAARFPATAELAICAIIVASLLGVALGVLAAVKKNKAADNVSMFIALIGVSMPIFWSGILLILLFSGILH